MSAYERIQASKAGERATITLAYPERKNALGPRMVSDLISALDDAMADASVRTVILTGAGSAFSAGGDFGSMNDGAPLHGDYADLLVRLWEADKPVIARVNGHALGGGLGIAAASTFAIAVDSALLGTPEINVGLFPMMILAPISRLMPRRRMVEMMLLGQKLPAAEAKEFGLVGRVVPAEGLDAAVDELAALLAGKSPVTLRLGLRALVQHEGKPFAEEVLMLKGRLAECLGTEDAREGLTAFMEKRQPKWTGR